MKDFFQNQIAMALVVLLILGIGAYVAMGASAKEVIVQIITAIGALVTGTALGRANNQRESDKPGTAPQNPT